jgi:hypothetical protein
MKTQNLILLGLGAFFLLRKTGGINGTNEKNDLGFGFLGNGLTVWDKNQTQNGDYKTVAHITNGGLVKLYKNHNLTPSAIKKIIKQSQAIIEHEKELFK